LRFAVRRLWQSGASPRSNRPPGGRVRDVACRVDVGVVLVPAGNAPEESLALATLPGGVAAGVAGLRRVTRIDLDHASRCFVLQPGHQPPPPVGENPPVQPSLLRDVTARFSDGALRRASHRLDLQVLDTDHIEPARQIGAGLLPPVPTPVTLTGLQASDRNRELSPPVGPVSRFGASAGQPHQSHGFRLTQAGRGQQFPGAQRRTHPHSPVHTHDLTIPWAGDRFGDRGERDMPTASPIMGGPERLNSHGYRTGPTEPHPPHLRDLHLTDMTGQTPHVTEFDRDDPEPAAPPTPPRPPVGPSEKVRPRLGEVLERLLPHHNRPGGRPPELRARLGQLTALLSEPWRGPEPGSPVGVLLDRQVPHEPGMPAMLGQHGLLGRRGLKTEAGHGHQPNGPHRQNSDNTMIDRAGFPPRPQGWGLHTVGAW
jgi:hypothetical protein